MNGLRLDDRRASLYFFATALLVVLPLAGCAKKQDRPARQVATVAVVPARRTTVPYMIEANGVVTPLQSVSVSPQVDGIINSVDFEEGQDVTVGQPLFHIDARPYQNAYEQALAVLSRDSASAANAAGERDRYKKLLDARVVTPEEAAVQFTTAATTDATVRSDRAAVASARLNMEYAVVRAPISGKTGSLLVRKGNLVHAGSGIGLVVINQVRPIYVRFAIPSSQLGLILQYGARGGLAVSAVPGGVAPASPSIDSLAAATMSPVQDGASQAGTLRDGAGSGGATAADGGGPSAGGKKLGGGRGAGRHGRDGGGGGAGGAGSSNAQQAAPAQPGDRMMGKLSFIDNAVDTTTGTVLLKATFDNSNGRLWAGQFASTSLHLFDEDSALVVPTQAVVTGQRGAYVYIVDQTDTARQRAVIVERTSGGLSVISSGVRDGDRVVTDGQSRLTPDSPVRLRTANDAGGGGAAAGGGRRGGGKGGKRGGGGGSAGGATPPGRGT